MQVDRRGPKIMVVDNDRTTLEMVRLRLEVAGYQPVAVRRPQEAVEVRAASLPAALILERDLPGVDAMALLQIMADDQKGAPIPVMLVGRKLEADDVRRGVHLGVRVCLTKPFSGHAIVERLERMLKKASASASGAANRPQGPALYI